MWREGLIYKIFRSDKLKIPKLLCKTIASYLTNRQIKIKYAKKLSRPFTPKAGVPQGSVLAPLLYIIYLFDTPETKRLENHFKETETLNLFYADDNNMAISSGLQNIIKYAKEELQRMASYETKWRIKIKHH